MKLTRVVLALCAAFAVSASSVSAATFVHPEDETGNVVLSASQQHHNLYTAGNAVTVNSPITGDLVVAGGSISTDATVEQDVIVAGGTVSINGNVGGDIRIFGGTLTINAPVNGDIVAFGGTIMVTDKATVGGDVVGAGGTVTLNAPINGKLWFAGGNINVNDFIGGEVKIHEADKVVFGAEANIAGKISVKAVEQPVVKDGARVSSIDFTKREDHGGKGLGAVFTMWLLVKFLGLVLAAWLFLHFFPKRLGGVVAGLKERFWPSLGIGFLVAVATPVAVILLLISFIGYYAALILIAWYAVVMLVSCLVGAIALGAFLLKHIMKRPEWVLDWQAVVVGVFGYMILEFIPVLGWIVLAAISLASFGAMLSYAKKEIIQ